MGDKALDSFAQRCDDRDRLGIDGHVAPLLCPNEADFRVTGFAVHDSLR